MKPEVFLRPWKKSDALKLSQLANNPNIWNNLRDSLPQPYTFRNAEEWIYYCNRQKPLLNFAVIYNTQLAGSIGCTTKTDVYRKSIEIGYFIGEKYWNLGIATHAVRILLDYIHKEFDVVRVTAEVFEYNKASMQVLHNNGFYLESIRRKAVVKNNILMDDYVWVKLLENKE